jgi:hypothetical protein
MVAAHLENSTDIEESSQTATRNNQQKSIVHAGGDQVSSQVMYDADERSVVGGVLCPWCRRSVQPTTNKTTIKLQKENKGKVNERVEKHAIRHDEKHLINEQLTRCRRSPDGAPVSANVDKDDHC